MLTKIECPASSDATSFLQVLHNEENKNPNSLYILFTGSKSSSTGSSWCPDCVRAEPLLHKALQEQQDSATLIVVNVDREPYRSPDFVFRKDPRFNLRCVPTLMKWEKGEAVLRLNDVQCQNHIAIEEFLST